MWSWAGNILGCLDEAGAKHILKWTTQEIHLKTQLTTSSQIKMKNPQ